MKKSIIDKEYIFAIWNKRTLYPKDNEIISVAEYLSKNYIVFPGVQGSFIQIHLILFKEPNKI